MDRATMMGKKKATIKEHPKGESHFPEEKPLRRNSERGDKEGGGGHPIHGASRRDGRSSMDQVGRLVRDPSARQKERHLSERRLGDKLEGPRIQTKTWREKHVSGCGWGQVCRCVPATVEPRPCGVRELQGRTERTDPRIRQAHKTDHRR